MTSLNEEVNLRFRSASARVHVSKIKKTKMIKKRGQKRLLCIRSRVYAFICLMDRYDFKCHRVYGHDASLSLLLYNCPMNHCVIIIAVNMILIVMIATSNIIFIKKVLYMTSGEIKKS